jgi:hypothetical protein
MSQDMDELWRRRFAIFAFLRISGLLLFLLGMAITFGNLLREGGDLPAGMVIIGAGLVEALLGPVILRQRWQKTDPE